MEDSEVMRQKKIHYIYNKEMECMDPEERRKLQGERLRKTLTQKCVHIHAHVLFFINSYIHSSLYIQFTIYYLVIFSVKAKVVK